MRGRLITVCGLIGSGKSTFTRDLADILKAVPLSEPAGDERNPYLPLFYADRRRWAFTMQTHLLQQRSEVHCRAFEEIERGRDVVMDSSVWQDMAYADMLHRMGHLNKYEYDTYRALARMVGREAMPPDVCVFLEVSVEECFQRIQTRMGEQVERTCEGGIDLNYLRHLKDAIGHNISKLENRVMFPWGDYLPCKEERMSRISNLMILIEDVCPTVCLH